MSMQFLADENFEGAIYRGLLRRRPHLDIVRVQDVGLTAIDDPQIIAWAWTHKRIILTHDKKTMPIYAYQRLAQNLSFTGMVVMKPTISVSLAIQDILTIVDCTSADEWINLVQDIPL